MSVNATSAPIARRPKTLESLSESQIRTIRSIPPHDQVSAPAIDASQPASIYLDQARYNLEQEKIFRAMPVPVTLSAMLKEPGSVLAHDGYGVPILLTRGKDGQVRAFLNACQHRGAKLVNTYTPEKASRVTCPYHSWTYGLDGKLVAVPREETFCNLDKENRNLAPLHSREAGGVIWVMLDREKAADFTNVDAGLIEDFDALGVPGAHVYGFKSFDLKANWKLVMEPFMEGYHVQRLHAKTVGPLFSDNPSITTRLGNHIRSISGRLNFAPDSVTAKSENIHKSIVQSYRVFPSSILITSPYYISFMIIMPTSVGTSKVDYFMLTDGPPDNPKAEDLYAKSYELILKVFGTEDFWAAEISQEGLASGAVKDVRFCGLEQMIPMYYNILESYF